MLTTDLTTPTEIKLIGALLYFVLELHLRLSLVVGAPKKALNKQAL